MSDNNEDDFQDLISVVFTNSEEPEPSFNPDLEAMTIAGANAADATADSGRPNASPAARRRPARARGGDRPRDAGRGRGGRASNPSGSLLGGSARDGDAPADLALDAQYEYRRLPLDRDPVDAAAGARPEQTTGCFMCDFASYLESNRDATDTGMPGTTHERDRVDAFAQLQNEVTRLIERSTNSSQLVDAVWQFYETEVRDLCDYGEWTKTMVHEHLFTHMRADERLYLDDMHRFCSAQIDFLRKRMLRRSLETGEDEFDIKTFNMIGKVHRMKTELFDKIRKLNDQAAP